MAAFVDTNILIYAYLGSPELEVEKKQRAKELLEHLMLDEALIVSAQVLNEFASNALRKAKPPLALAGIYLIVSELSRFQVLPIDASLILLTLTRVETSRLSYWDALIVEAALRSGASILYTEDMHHGTHYGSLELRNPFLA